MRRVKFDASLFLLAAILILLTAGVAFAALALRSDPIEEALLGDRVINTLFVLDKGGKPLNSYVLMYYPATRRAAVFDIPGEVGLIIKQINRVDRIDTVYNRHKLRDFETEIEGLLGIDISFSVVIDEADLGRIVDILEGVEIFIPAPVEIYEGEDTVLFPSGVIRLDGDKARRYVTYELPGEEPEIVSSRRQRFFLGFVKRLGEMNETLKTPQVNAVNRAFFGTTMNQRTRFRLFDEFSGINTDHTNIQSVGGTSREVSGQTLLFPYYDGSLIKDIVRQTLGGLTRPAGGAASERVFTVEILNGTAVNGLAGRTAELLRGFGYDVISVGNADRNDYEKTEIIDRSGYEDGIRAFSDIVKCQNIRSEAPVTDNLDMELSPQSFEYRSDFTLIIGRDFNGRYASGG
jgi:anionic cell wall polymer biosynthesis LytR-Cps2A-Psr (LCP) family protein